jgi:hypothetical protein
VERLKVPRPTLLSEMLDARKLRVQVITCRRQMPVTRVLFFSPARPPFTRPFPLDTRTRSPCTPRLSQLSRIPFVHVQYASPRSPRASAFPSAPFAPRLLFQSTFSLCALAILGTRHRHSQLFLYLRPAPTYAIQPLT